MSSEQTAASTAVIASCAGRGTLTTLVSTSTVFTTLPTVTNTFYNDFTYSDTQSNGSGVYTTHVLITVRLPSIPTETKFVPVTHTACIDTALIASTASAASATLSTQPTVVAAPTTTTTSPESRPDPQPGNRKTLLITATVISVSVILILATALGFWIWRRTRKKKLELASRNELMEAESSSYSPGRGLHKKFSLGTTINDTASTSPTVVDYVGLMPSVSQRNLVGPASDVQSAVDTDWSKIRPSSIALRPGRVHGVNSQYRRPNRVSTRRPSQSRHPYISNYDPSYSRHRSEVVPQIPTAESYTSRGTSAFLRPTEAIRGQNGEFSYGPSQEHILLPTVYSPDSARLAVPMHERDDDRPPCQPDHSQPDPDYHFPSSPSRERVWAEALQRLEGIHRRRPVDFTRDPTGDSQVTETRDDFNRHHIEGSAMSDERDYETIMYESEGESRARSLREPGRDNTDESVFSLDAVVRRIANEPPRERGRR
ncbi:hypothetical protein VE01_00706 [Pseudogymnoascus verrucosus]|uniref:Uncharacterized protein n=1 Tax=Pseudogymnoascus verrucosus TaxID=342668 RepID=A0A2P2SXW4_9PEZI|nr:uncharacterized protein VE01_00706 [Pseudogymnoascus verrucosus]OBU01085.1 hypothetical protein VE01_00706 [Pseudogymnoascus verrucosus]